MCEKAYVLSDGLDCLESLKLRYQEMKKKPTINVYIGNHGKKDGIEDYLMILKDVFAQSGHDVEITEELKGDAVNIIIDEFTNYFENRKIAEFRSSHPESIIAMVLTEFVERKWFVWSFNHFGSLIDSMILSLLNVVIRKKRGDYRPASWKDYALAAGYCPLAVPYVMFIGVMYLFSRVSRKRLRARRLDNLKRKVWRLAYFHMRYLGLERNMVHADLILSSHQAIIRGIEKVGWFGEKDRRYIGVVHPILDKQKVLGEMFSGKGLFMEITGSVTRYRKKWIEKYNCLIQTYGIHHVLGYAQSFGFDRVEGEGDERRGAYSFHPPQRAKWAYASPTRLFRSLQVDHNIPVITRHFGQHAIEDVCVRFHGADTLMELVKMYKDRSAMEAYLEPRIDRYNDLAQKSNGKIVKKILRLVERRETTVARRNGDSDCGHGGNPDRVDWQGSQAAEGDKRGLRR